MGVKAEFYHRLFAKFLTINVKGEEHIKGLLKVIKMDFRFFLLSDNQIVPLLQALHILQSSRGKIENGSLTTHLKEKIIQQLVLINNVPPPAKLRKIM